MRRKNTVVATKNEKVLKKRKTAAKSKALQRKESTTSLDSFPSDQSMPRPIKSIHNAGWYQKREVSRNPFLNFLSDFRDRYVNMPRDKALRLAAYEWDTLPSDVRLHYVAAAFYARRHKLGVITPQKNIAKRRNFRCYNLKRQPRRPAARPLKKMTYRPRPKN